MKREKVLDKWSDVCYNNIHEREVIMKKYTPPVDVIRTKINHQQFPGTMVDDNAAQFRKLLKDFPYLTPFHYRIIHTLPRTVNSPPDEMAYQVLYEKKDSTWPGFLVENEDEIIAMMDIVKEYKIDEDPSLHWCLQCGYNWKDKGRHETLPTMCPACKRRHWNIRKGVNDDERTAE